MDIKMICEKPDTMNYTMTITMNCKEWEELQNKMLTTKHEERSYVMDCFIDGIGDVLQQAREVYRSAGET